MKLKKLPSSVLTVLVASAMMCAVATGQAADKKPNILFIMGDDVGWFNIGAYHQGIMSGKTPNIDRIAREGVRFTDYYAEASCTAGRAHLIPGQLPCHPHCLHSVSPARMSACRRKPAPSPLRSKHRAMPQASSV